MDYIKCNCGNKIKVGANFCNQCGVEINYAELDAKENMKLKNFIMKTFIVVFLMLFIVISISFKISSNTSYFKDDTPEFQQFCETFDLVMSLNEDVVSYKILKHSIIINLDNKSWMRAEQVANTTFTMIENADILKKDKTLSVDVYCKDEHIGTFYSR